MSDFDDMASGRTDREDAELVRLDVDAGIGLITLDRPKVNALNFALQSRLRAVAGEVSERSDVASVIITGGDHVFAAGADIKQMAAMSYADMARYSTRLHEVFTAIATIPKPVVAAINGYALGGGCELALCADIRIAADDAILGQPEIGIGVIPGGGGTQRLTRLVGPARAKDLIFTGRFVPADEALAIGLVDRVVPADQVLATARAWAEQFVDGPALALRAAKQCIDAGLDLASGLELERVQFAALFATEDRAIGMQSFIDNGPGRAAFLGR